MASLPGFSYYSLIGGLGAAVICRRYFRNRSVDLNPDFHNFWDRYNSLTSQSHKKLANQLKFRPQYVDFSCLHPAKKIRIHSNVILITYQIH